LKALRPNADAYLRLAADELRIWPKPTISGRRSSSIIEPAGLGKGGCVETRDAQHGKREECMRIQTGGIKNKGLLPCCSACDQARAAASNQTAQALDMIPFQAAFLATFSATRPSTRRELSGRSPPDALGGTPHA